MEKVTKLFGNKNSFVLLIGLALFLPVLLGFMIQRQSAVQHAATTHQVTIQNFTMTPISLTVNVGDTVTWTNRDEIQHDAHSTQDVFRSPLLSKDESWSFTFTQSGTFEYFCTPHQASMKGYTITVLPAAAAKPTEVPAATPTLTTTPTLLPATPTQAAKQALTAPTLAVPTQLPTQVPQTNADNTTQAGGPATVSVIVSLDGIGAAGDHANPNDTTLSNKSPQTTQLPLALILVNSGGQSFGQPTGLVNYSSATGDYRGTISLGAGVPAGVYTIQVKMLKYLTKTVAKNFSISTTTVNTLPSVTLTSGDVDNNDILNTQDYNALLTCLDKITGRSNCEGTKRQLADLNDDGTISLVDTNLFLREFPVGKGD